MACASVREGHGGVGTAWTGGAGIGCGHHMGIGHDQPVGGQDDARTLVRLAAGIGLQRYHAR